jgi:hypothetical protein
VRIEIELIERDPPAGSVRPAAGAAVTFDGWLGLIQALSEAIGPIEPHP